MRIFFCSWLVNTLTNDTIVKSLTKLGFNEDIFCSWLVNTLVNTLTNDTLL